MARKRKDNALGILAFIIGLPVLFANWLYDTLGMPTWLTYTLLLAVAITVLFAYFTKTAPEIQGDSDRKH